MAAARTVPLANLFPLLEGGELDKFLFTATRGLGQCMTTRQYARLLSEWIASIGLDPHLFGTHSLRRTKATLITAGPATCVPCSYCSATPRLRAPSDISVLRSMTLFP
jgi:integrase